MNEELTTRASPFLQPIPGANPAGHNASFDPRYEGLRTEFGKLDSPTGGEIDWKAATQQARELLTSVTKDLLIASYNAFALLQLEGWPGLGTGLAVLHGMLEGWWDQGFPPPERLRARGNSVDWLVPRLEIALASGRVEDRDVPAFEAAREAWAELSTLARDRLQNHCPAMGGVAEAFARLRLSIPPELLAQAANASATAADAAAPPASSAGATDSAGANAPTGAPTRAPGDLAGVPGQASGAPTGDSASEQSAAEQSAAEQSAAEQPAAEQPAAEQPAAEQSAAEQPAAEPEQPADPFAPYLAQCETWLQPFGGDNPAGPDPRYEPAYELARNEVAKLESITDSSVEWKLVVDNASKILSDHAKDLLMASYLAYAKFQMGGLPELVVGLALCEQLLDRFWEGVHPERSRGRSNALEWLLTRLEPALAAVKLEPRDRPQVLALEIAVNRLLQATRERFESDGPSSAGLGDRIKRMLLAVPEAAAAPKPAPPPAAAAAQPQPPASNTTPTGLPGPSAPLPGVATVNNAEEVVGFLQETGRALVRAASLLRAASATNASAYRLLRVGLYLHLTAPPPADAGGKTQVPALPANRRQQLGLMESNGKWEPLLEESESALQQFRFCIDLHRYSYRALERLGDTFTGARQELVAEVASLLQRMPGLLELTANDGSPLADPETKTWVHQVVLAGSGGVGASAGESGDSDATVMAEIRGLMTGGKPTDAIRIGQAHIEKASHGRQRFARRLSLAQVCLDTNQVALARGMFAALEQELGERQLAEWEPELGARCLEGYVRALRAAAKLGARVDNPERVFERLCLVDPIAAARLASNQ